MRMETLVSGSGNVCQNCITIEDYCDDWLLVDEDEETKQFTVACAKCNHEKTFKVEVKEIT